MTIDHRPDGAPTPGGEAELRRRNTDRVCRHLALVAVDGATAEVFGTLDPGFVLHLDEADTDRSGYLALIEANHAAHGTPPPLDVLRTMARGSFVTASLDPSWIAHFKVGPEAIEELWLTSRWEVWRGWLARHRMT